MPRTTITMIEGKPSEYKSKIYNSIYDGMRAAFNIPEDDIFMSINEVTRENICYSKGYMGSTRTDDILMIEIIASDTRTIEQKKALYSSIVQNLIKNIKIRSEDIFINLIGVDKENWSFGNGLAQYA